VKVMVLIAIAKPPVPNGIPPFAIDFGKEGGAP